MTETTNRILQGIAAFQQELQQRVNKEVKEITEEEYIFLLSGPASCRMIPGIQENMGYEEMYYCKTEEDKTEARAYLKRLYAIED
ncbi:MAG: hypothetical protein LIP01_08780, partial [Tannerellaceae bacterium]|nr:hypothetical protein [Tannerellaceae bacterium]